MLTFQASVPGASKKPLPVVYSLVLAEWTLLFLIAALPLFFLPFEWLLPSQAKMLLLIVGMIVEVGALTVVALYERVIKIPRNSLLIVGALLPIAYATSAWVSGAPQSSWVSADPGLDTVARAAFFYGLLLISAIVTTTAEVRPIRIIRAFGTGVLALFLFVLLNLIFPELITPLKSYSATVASPLGLPHDIGILALLCLAGAGSWMFSRLGGEEISEWWLAGIGFVSLLLLVSVNAFDTWLVLAIVSLVCALGAMWVDLKQYHRPFAFAFIGSATWLVFAGVGLIMAVFGSTLTQYVPENLQLASVEVRPSWQGTVSVGEHIFASDQKALLFGSGPSTFARAWMAHKPDGVNLTNFWGVDFTSGVGLIPTSVVTVGVLGAVSWLVLVFFLAYKAVALFWARKVCVRDNMHVLILTIAGVLMLYHIVYVPAIALSALMFMLLGVFASISRSSQKMPFEYRIGVESQFEVLRFVGAGLVIGLFVWFSSVAGRSLVSGVMVQQAAAVYRNTGDLTYPRKLVEWAIKIHPNNTQAQRAAVELGTLELARLAATTDAASEQGRAQLQALLGQTIQYGLAAVAADGTDYQNWLALADLYQKLAGSGVDGSYQGAKEAYEKAIAANPSDPSLLLRLAQLESAQGDLVSALAYTNQAIGLKRNYTMAYFLRSRLAAETGDMEAAKTDALVVVQMMPKDPLGWYNLGGILFTAGLYQDAVTALNEAIALQPEYADAYYVLSLSYEKLNKKTEARAALEQVARLNPENVDVKKALLRLQATTTSPIKGSRN